MLQSAGYPGRIGNSGSQGEGGQVGDPGPKGDKGSKGDQGQRGLNGLDGPVGGPGRMGRKGQKGDQGPKACTVEHTLNLTNVISHHNLLIQRLGYGKNCRIILRLHENAHDKSFEMSPHMI